MFGAYRFVLALTVALVHLRICPWPWMAWYSVFAFYVLSGFLMTLVLNESYDFSRAGLKRFAWNRFLRIYPAYYTVILLAVVWIIADGDLTPLHRSLQWPQSAGSWLVTLTLIGQAGFSEAHIFPTRLIPNAWSLAVELACYLILALWAARSAKRMWALFTLGAASAFGVCAAAQDMTAGNYHFMDRYVVIQAGFIPYALGGLAYFHRHRWRFRAKPVLFVSVTLLVVLAWSARDSMFMRYVAGIYSVTAVFVAVTLALYRLPRTRWDDYLGTLSYPLFVCHWVVASITAKLAVAPEAYQGMSAKILYLISSLMAAWLIARYIDMPIDRFRHGTRAKHAQVVAVNEKA